MKTLLKMEISEELNAQIDSGMKLSELYKADIVRQAFRIGLPQFASRFQPAPLWLEERIREALAEPAEGVPHPFADFAFFAFNHPASPNSNSETMCQI
jgi:hypothetical protein